MLVLGEAWFGPTMGLLQKAVRKSVAGRVSCQGRGYAYRSHGMSKENSTVGGQATSMMLGIATLAGNLGPAIIGILDPGKAHQ